MIDLRQAMPIAKNSLQWVIIGKKGCGKSTLTAEIIHEYIKQRKRKRFVIVDHRLGLYQPLRRMGFRAAQIAGTRPIPWHDVLAKNPKLLIFTNNILFEDVYEHLNSLASALLDMGNALLWIDEAHLYYPSPESKAPRGLRLLVRDARKRAVDIGFTTQIIVDLGISALKEADAIAIFKLTEENELEKAGKYAPEGVIRRLDRYQYVLVDMMRGKVHIGKTRRKYAYA